MTPTLSIVIPSHTRADLLRLCLASVVAHAPTGTEVIVVDDGSANGLIADTAATFPGVRIVRNESAQGFCVAANRGIAAANGPIVELLNDDTQVTAGWAELALRAFADPRVAAVAPLVLQGPGPEQPPRIDSAGDQYDIGGFAHKRGHGEPWTPGRFPAGPVFGASASSAFYRRDAVLAVGGFPEEFGAYFEDVDLSFRLRWAGYEIVHEPDSRVWHRVSASYGLPRRALLAQQSCNEERVFWRNVPLAWWWRALPRHALVVFAKGVRRWREGQLGPFLRGRLQVLRELPALYRHRRWLRDQARRAGIVRIDRAGL